MTSFPLFVFLVLLPRVAVVVASHTCSKSASCTRFGPLIRFPFYIMDDEARTGRQKCAHSRFQGFGVECNDRNQTIINLPYSGDFLIVNISYVDQTIVINDPEGCLARRFVPSFNIDGSPFKSIFDVRFTFLNCTLEEATLPSRFVKTCLSEPNATVLATRYDSFIKAMSPWCRNITSTYIPFQLSLMGSGSDSVAYELTSDLRDNMLLSWDLPDCRSCETGGGTCSLKKGSDQEIECSGDGASTSSKYRTMICLGIPGIFCITGITALILAKIKSSRQLPRPSIDISNLTPSPSPAGYSTGLDGSTIESYPKTQLGESKRLPQPNQSTCPICLSEYQPNDTLRTIPDCSHYFHATCIDEWLRMNATCPWCRNSPLNRL